MTDEPDELLELDTLWIFPAGADLSFFETQPERVLEIAIRAFARATREAIAENDRLGIPSYGGKGGKIVVRHPPKSAD
jgi:hypothetical protein